MEKYYQALKHSWSSLLGWLRLRAKQPEFARKLLRSRWNYFRNREFAPGLVTPDGLVLSTPDMLITYWSMFVERELYHSDWIASLQAASHPLVIDVGANAGLFSHLVFCLNPNSEIVAFEPLPLMVARINDLKTRNDMNLKCVPKAVGRFIGTATLESPHGYEGISRICTSSEFSGQRFQVDMTTLDQELKGRFVLLMKIDVEGFEEEVIAGAIETLSRTKYVIIEAQNKNRRDCLTKLLGPEWKRNKLGASDYLFIRS